MVKVHKIPFRTPQPTLKHNNMVRREGSTPSRTFGQRCAPELFCSGREHRVAAPAMTGACELGLWKSWCKWLTVFRLLSSGVKLSKVGEIPTRYEPAHSLSLQ